MAAPSISINLIDLTVFNPQQTEPILGLVGPATKGPIDQLTEITDVGNFQNQFGVAPNKNYYTQRAGNRYLERGTNLKFNRVAGVNVRAATLTLKAADDVQSILALTTEGSAGDKGTWANGDLQVSVTHNGTASYNVLVYFKGGLVEQYIAVDNGIVASRINNESNRMRATLVGGAGATFPGETINPVTLAVDRLSFAGGNDGALATTDSEASSTSGVAGRRFYGKMDSVAGSRVFENIVTIDASLASKAEVYGTVGMPVVPGSFTIQVQTAAGPVYVELSDDGDESYALGGAGLGFLIPSAGAHRGFIDYRTGQWGVQLAAATTFLTGTIDGIWMRANAESAGATVRGTGEYAGNFSAGPMGVGFYNSNKVVLTVPIDERCGDVPIAAGVGTSSGAATLKTLAGWVVPGTVVLTPSHATDAVPPPIYDDGFGGFRTEPLGGGVSVVGAAIDYRTGVWSAPAWDPVGAVIFPAVTPSQLQAEYDIHLFDMGGGAVAGPNGAQINDEVLQAADPGGDALASSADLGAVPVSGPYPFLPGNIKLVISSLAAGAILNETWYDDGLGGWLDRPRGDPRAVAAGAGAIDYTTGIWSITASAAIDAGATILVDYVRSAPEQARRSLRGTGPQFVADATANAAGVNLDEPAAANNQNGTNWLDHATGQFALELDLLTTGTNTFNVKDNGTITAVYVGADILGFGDGSTTVFTGQLEPAPFRREDDRLLAFQGAQASAAGAGDPQVSFATTGADADNDFWSQNVALPTDPDNTLDYRDGTTSIQWTGAPTRDEAVYAVAEEVVLHVEAKYPGDTGNERLTLTDGFYAELGPDPTLDNPDGTPTLRLQVFFDSVLQESWGQAADLDELVDTVNTNSTLILVSLQDAGTFLPPDLTATQQLGMAGAFTNADVIGTKVGQVYTGLQVFQNHETVDVDFIMLPGIWHRQVILALQTLCETQDRRCIGIIPAPDLDDPLKFRDFYNGNYSPTVIGGGVATPSVTVPFPPLVEINSHQLCTVMPWVQNFDQANNVSKFEPGSAEIARLIAKTPASHMPVAGFRRGKVTSEVLRFSAAKTDRNLIQGIVGSRVEICNPIVRRVGRGLFLLGQQTAYRTPGSVLGRISVRWTLNLLMNRISLTSLEFLFEINDPILWREATARLNAIFKPVIERRGLVDAWVVVDQTTVTAEARDRLAMPGKLFVKPSLDVEQVEYDLILTPQGADFADIVVG